MNPKETHAVCTTVQAAAILQECVGVKDMEILANHVENPAVEHQDHMEDLAEAVAVHKFIAFPVLTESRTRDNPAYT